MVTMSLFERLLGRRSRDSSASGGALHPRRELGPALGEYQAALDAFDGADEERGSLEITVAEVHSELRVGNIDAAKRLAAEDDLTEAGYELESALDRSVTEEEREAKLVSLREQVSKPDRPSNFPGKRHETELTAVSHDDAESCMDVRMRPYFAQRRKG